MRRRHMVSFKEHKQTLCGHSATEQEFRRMKLFADKDVTCKRCLNLYQSHLEKTSIDLEANTHLPKAKA
ncbi:MAG: hypothetical protein BEU00_02145 [Marine Group III euryarchaeote CG-Epi3]|uniref:Uncharacterized protein n=1 Tax=Marine Group III euryarchaeote CG-Epi3 TaxID=1888997 RepID=A0A1J5U556_9ARCH|nr:MAG: hypothetical protein BEU00_02145 [Marine Group III euryarchaeote CG-Epi3]